MPGCLFCLDQANYLGDCDLSLVSFVKMNKNAFSSEDYRAPIRVARYQFSIKRHCPFYALSIIYYMNTKTNLRYV